MKQCFLGVDFNTMPKKHMFFKLQFRQCLMYNKINKGAKAQNEDEKG